MEKKNKGFSKSRIIMDRQEEDSVQQNKTEIIAWCHCKSSQKRKHNVTSFLLVKKNLLRIGNNIIVHFVISVYALSMKICIIVKKSGKWQASEKWLGVQKNIYHPKKRPQANPRKKPLKKNKKANHKFERNFQRNEIFITDQPRKRRTTIPYVVLQSKNPFLKESVVELPQPFWNKQKDRGSSKYYIAIRE